MSNGITAWSYSRYADYQQCPLKFKLKYIDKLPVKGSPAMERGNVIHKKAEDYIKAKRPPKLPEELQTVKKFIDHCREHGAICEQEMGFRQDWSWTGKADWFGRDVWFRMKMDVAVAYDDDTGLVGDWKTGRRYEENKDQVRLFGAVSLMRFPEWSEVDVRLWYTDQPEGENEYDETFTRKDAELILSDWNKKVVPLFKDKRFAPKPNDRCKWCDFSKREGGPCKF